MMIAKLLRKTVFGGHNEVSSPEHVGIADWRTIVRYGAMEIEVHTATKPKDLGPEFVRSAVDHVSNRQLDKKGFHRPK